MQAGLKRRSGPLFGAVLVLGAVVGLVTPAVPKVAATAPSFAPAATQPDATPPDASPTTAPDVTPAPDSPTPAPAPTATPGPTQPPTDPPTATPAPTDPTAPSDSPIPSDSALPSDSAAPSDSPVPSDSAVPSDSPVPSGSPAPSESASPSPTPTPVAIAPLVLANPNSPHIVSSGLNSDTCGACHATHHAKDPNLLSTTYRVNPLRASGEAYKAADFALCWACHASTKAAIEDATGATSGTNFPRHGYHLKGIDGKGAGGTDITTPGDGQGNALCAECHYNLHGTADAQRGLVEFAPDVVAYGGLPITYDAASGTCTLTCHGVNHDAAMPAAH